MRTLVLAVLVACGPATTARPVLVAPPPLVFHVTEEGGETEWAPDSFLVCKAEGDIDDERVRCARCHGTDCTDLGHTSRCHVSHESSDASWLLVPLLLMGL